MEMSGQLNIPAALLQENNPLPIEQEAEWAPEPVWTFWGRKKSLAPTTIQTLGHPACRLETIPNTLPQLPSLLMSPETVNVLP
jgi:hypothetical protein